MKKQSTKLIIGYDKRIYIVRHGQSEANAVRAYPTIETKLSPLGHEQSQEIAKRVAGLDFQAIFSSDLPRAVETAETIGKKMRIKHIVTALAREEKDPSELSGQGLESSDAKKFKKLSHKHRNDQKWHFSDEENFFDLKSRVAKFLDFLEKRKEKEILLVGHVMATRMLVGIMIFGDCLSPDIYEKMRARMVMKNTGITICDLITGEWKLVTWNDHKHLG